MTDTEALHLLIQDVSTSFAAMQQDIPADFQGLQQEKAHALHQQIQIWYQEGAYTEAFHACEKLVHLLEEIEIAYMFHLEKSDVDGVHTQMHDTLDRVTTDPESIHLDERREEIEAYKERLHTMSVPVDTRLYRIVYHNLLRLELVLLLSIIWLTILHIFLTGVGNEQGWYLITLLAVLGLGIRILRMTRHSGGVLVMIVIALLIALGSWLL